MPEYNVPALERAFRIIDTLERASLGLTKTDIAYRVGLPYSSVFNLLCTLERLKCARKDPETGRYYLGPRLATLRRVEADLDALRHAAASEMRKLIAGTLCTSHLAILRDGEAVYVEKQEPKGFFKLNTWVGQRVYPHTSAVGKALAAHLSMAEVQEIWRRGLPRRTDKTIMSFRRYWKELQLTRQRGYALDDEEDQVGGRCVAAPVFAPNGGAAASLGLSAMSVHLPAAEMPAVAGRVVEAAREVSRSIGGLFANPNI